MKKLVLVVLIPLGLWGCISYQETPPPARNTVVVPPGSTVTCSNGYPGPC